MQIMKNTKQLTESEQFHSFSVNACHKVQLNKELSRINDKISIYDEQVSLMMKELDKAKSKTWMSKIDEMKLYFRYYWLAKHGIYIEDGYNLSAIQCNESFMNRDKDYIHLQTRNNASIVFMKIEDVDHLPIYVKDDIWKLAVKDGKTEQSKEDFISTGFADLCIKTKHLIFQKLTF